MLQRLQKQTFKMTTKEQDLAGREEETKREGGGGENEDDDEADDLTNE